MKNTTINTNIENNKINITTAARKEAEYNELVTALTQSFFEYLKNEYYRNDNLDDEYIQQQAQEMAEDEAYTSVYELELYA